jgi:hypothetical protein
MLLMVVPSIRMTQTFASGCAPTELRGEQQSELSAGEMPMTSSLMNRPPVSRPRLLFVTLVSLFVTTCHEQGAEDVEILEAAMGPAGCGLPEVRPNEDRAFRIDPELFSPSTYNNGSKCLYGWVVDLSFLDAEYAGVGASIQVRWRDLLLSSNGCSHAYMRAIFYEGTALGAGGAGGTGGINLGSGGAGPKQWTLLDDRSARGLWQGGSCQLMFSFAGLGAGKTYRIAATAQYPPGKTRMIGIKTVKP